jgi:hypothetical protein
MAKLINYDIGNPFIATQTTVTASTTSVSNVLMGSVLIPANTFVVGDVVRCYAMYEKVGANAAATVRFYANTTNDLSGSPVLLGVYTPAVASAGGYPLFRKYTINATSGSNTFGYNTSTTTQGNDTQPIATALEIFNLNWTSDLYLIASANVGSASDTLTFRYLKVANG